MSELSERLRKAIEARGILQKDLASKVNIAHTYLSSILNNKREPGERLIDDICEELKISKEWLMTGNGNMDVELTREQEIAALVDVYLSAEPESFKSRFISMISRLTEEQWEVLALMHQNIEKKE